jgi:uncharacterized protein
MSAILITGGSGMIGTALSEELEKRGHSVRHLSRERIPGRYKVYQWNVDRNTIDDDALLGVDHIVHLAGAGIADKRWTDERVKALIDSRAKAARLLLQKAIELKVTPKSFISAAGVGYYGVITSDHIFNELDPAGSDTIAQISREWEDAVREWEPICRTVRLRTPVVLSRRDGALDRLAAPVKLGLGAALGSGKQWMPWVHLDDLVAFYVRSIEDTSLSGAYNVVAGNVTNDQMMRSIAKVLGRPFFLPNVPAFALKLALGKLSSILLEGSRISNKKVLNKGYDFRYTDLEEALKDLLR